MAEELKVKITADASSFKNELSGTEKAVNSFSSKMKAFGGAVVKGIGAAVVAGGTAIVALTKSAVQSYAEYEQLSGGVRKLFGEDSAAIMQYADNAYKTSGLSANKYMELSTSFASSLIQSYSGDTAKAAEMTDLAMRSMSDNWNTYGSDFQSIQNAYQGFAKQNYTMLDNLKLGYGGTKTEMERLIADANEYAASIGEASDLSIENFGDIVQAIDLVQRKQGIAGTTSMEAASTISGSFAMTKAAWENLVTAFANPDADLSAYFDNLAQSAETAFTNLLPVVQQALMGIGTVIQDLAPVLGEKFPALMADVAPSLMGAVSSLIQSLATSLPAMIEPIMGAIIAALPSIISAGIQLFAGLASAAAQAIPQIVAAIPDIIMAIVSGFAAAGPDLLAAGIALMTMLADGMQAAGDFIQDVVIATGQLIATTASSIWSSISAALSSIWAKIVSTASTTFRNLSTSISSIFSSIAATASSIWNNVKTVITNTINSARDSVKNAINTMKGFFKFTWSLPPIKLPHFSISGSFSLNPPSVPHFSISWFKQGGVFDMPTLFGFGNGKIGGLGEDGAEAIVPLENNTQWLDRIAERLGEKIGNNPVVLEVDGKVFGQIACDSINGLTRQTGRLNIMMA